VAEDVTTSSSSVPAAAPPAAVQTLPGRRARRSENARKSSYKLRFGLVYVFLAAVLGAGVGAFVVLATGDDPEPDAQWSEWQPTGSQRAMLRQIADRIPKGYTEDGDQLVISTAGLLSVPTEQGDVPIENIFVQPDTSKGLAEEEDIEVYDGESVVSFALCGVGNSDQCAITRGTPSAERFTLLRRQALELSLYTLRYVDDVDSVIVFMPPTPKGESNGTVFLTRKDVSAELKRPLADLLPARNPSVGTLSEIEEGHVLRLTEPRTYAFQFQAAPNGSPILVLSPPSEPAS
jgi:hypothetical protein